MHVTTAQTSAEGTAGERMTTGEPMPGGLTDDRHPPGHGGILGATLGLTLLTVIYFVLFAEVPWDNEGVYLIAPWKWWRPDFLANDWAFGLRWREHTLYDATAGLLSLILPMTAFAWVLRIICWSLAYYALLRLARRLGLTPLAGAVALLLWIAVGQSILGSEFVIGDAEAKVPAYATLFLALELLLERRDCASGLLLGLTFSVHPAVGAGAMVGIAGALLLIRAPLSRWSTIGIWFIPAALPGLVTALLMSRGIEPNSAANWELLVRAALPWHMDPKYFPLPDDILFLALTGLLAAVTMLDRVTDEWRVVLGFVAGTGVLALGGLAARAVHAFWALQVYPFRLFPLVVPLFLCFAVVGRLFREPREGARRYPLGLAVGAACALLAAYPLGQFTTWADRLLRHGRPTTSGPDVATVDDRAAQRWVADSTPPDAIILQSPWDRQSFFFTRRAAVVSFWALRVDRMNSWWSRLQDLSGPVSPLYPPSARHLHARFDSLSTEAVLRLAHRYRTSFLVTHGTYPFPLRFSAGRTRVYTLPPF
jgi:hypothetical protein